MAKIVYGFGSSHGPLLTLAPERWPERAVADHRNPALAYRDGTYTYEELYALRKSNYLEDQTREEVRKERFAACQKQLDALGDKIAEVAPDVIVLVGDDQHEWFQNDIQPAITVYCGETVVNQRLTEEHLAKLPPGIAPSARMNKPTDKDHIYPVATDLANAIIAQAITDEFDVTSSSEEPKGKGIGHAVGFIYRRILRDKPVPVVPILLNTFYPPNQIKPKRCHDFGKSVGRAIEAWDGDARVAVCASGGMSHYVVDEEWDLKMLNAFLEHDEETVRNEPNIMFRSGTSETKNWITAAGAVAKTGLEMKLLDYVPCYRSEAGTGSGMAFATWT